MVTSLAGLFGVAAALNGFLYRSIHPLLRVAIAAGGLCMMIPGTLTDVIGLVVVAAVVLFQRGGARKKTASLHMDGAPRRPPRRTFLPRKKGGGGPKRKKTIPRGELFRRFRRLIFVRRFVLSATVARRAETVTVLLLYSPVNCTKMSGTVFDWNGKGEASWQSLWKTPNRRRL